MPVLHSHPFWQIALLTILCGSISFFPLSEVINAHFKSKPLKRGFTLLFVLLDFASSAWICFILFRSLLEANWNQYLIFDYYEPNEFPDHSRRIPSIFNGTELQALFGVCLISIYTLFPWPKKQWFHIFPKVVGVTLGALPHLTFIPLIILFSGWALLGNIRIALLLSPIGIPIGSLLKFDYCITFPPPSQPHSGFTIDSAYCSYSASWAGFGLWIMFALLVIFTQRTTIEKLIKNELPTYFNRLRWPKKTSSG